ncbi:MAG: Saccharopine dehydrogenase [Pycnora praestabilis]|nr:MAG: Saccharopine dehydrogenase [Pycnora praestabilis]
MKSTALLLLRSLTSAIHPPLPLNPRESQQLLSLLTNSFKQKLNQEHPPFRTEGPHHEAARSLHPRNTPTNNRQEKGGDYFTASASSSSVADHHLQTILTNPLFAVEPRRRSGSSRQSRLQHGNFTEAQRMLSDPIGWFEGHVSSGTATLDMAVHCLEAHMRTIISSPVTSIGQQMRISRAGSKVLTWITSGGLCHLSDIPTEQKLVAILIPFLVAEKNSEIVREWLNRMIHTIQKDRPWTGELVSSTSQNAAHLLFYFVKAEVNYGEGLNAAIEIFISYAQASKTIRRGTIPTARYLTSLLTVQSNNPLASDVYDAFTSTIQLNTPHKGIPYARLRLYHPSRPSAEAALNLLRTLSQKSPQISLKTRRKIVELALETAHLLIAQEDYVDATWVMDFIRRTFPQELGLQDFVVAERQKQPERNTSTSDELSNLQLLKNLEY